MRTLFLLLAAAGLALPSVPAAAQAAPALTLEQRMKLRCSAAFAIVAQRQVQGEGEALRYPELSARGREFFVRSAAEVMDESGLDRAQIDAALRREAGDLVAAGTLDQVMPVCLVALADAGL